MIFTSLKSRTLSLCFIVCALFVANTARADIEWTDLTGETEYTPTGKLYFTVTPTASGTLVIRGYGTPMFAHYTDETATTEGEYSYLPDNGYTKYMVSVTSGETYYFYYNSLESNKTFTITLLSENTAPTLTWQYPGEDEDYKLDINYYGYIAFKFDIEVTFDKVVLEAPDNEDAYMEVTPYYAGGYYNVTTKYILSDWLDYGLIEGGDEIKLTITGLAAASDGTLYNGDGTLELTFYAPNAPTKVVGGDQDSDGNSLIAWPTTFYSWWDKGDETGIVKIEFTQDLLPMDDPDQTACGTLGYGNKEDENGNYYLEDITDLISIDGNVLTVDFTGKDRTRLTMLPNAATEYDQVLVIIHLVRDKYGEYCYSSGSGSVASYQAFIPYEDIGIPEDDEESGNDDENNGDDVTDGISSVSAGGNSSNVYYNVAGQRVAAPSKGLYINNGKKVVVK